jgi:protein gp37
MELGASCYCDDSFNWLGGCLPVDRSCRNCWAAERAGTLIAARDVALYRGTTKRLKDGRNVFCGVARPLARGHPAGVFPLTYPGAEHPKLGDGMPSLIALNWMGDTFLEKHSDADIDRGLAVTAASAHIGLLLTRRPARMLDYFLGLEAELSPEALRRWRSHLWPGFSAGHQEEFNKYWPSLRPLAQRGWTTLVSIAPLIEPVELPEDFLRLAKWVIVSGEKTEHERCRYMDPAWARSLLAQCRKRIPFFMKRMSFDEHIPQNLLVRQFPHVATDTSISRRFGVCLNSAEMKSGTIERKS